MLFAHVFEAVEDFLSEYELLGIPDEDQDKIFRRELIILTLAKETSFVFGEAGPGPFRMISESAWRVDHGRFLSVEHFGLKGQELRECQVYGPFHFHGTVSSIHVDAQGLM